MRGALTKCDGVKDVQIDLENRLATVTFDGEKVKPEQLVDAVKGAREDFDNTSVKTN